MEVAGRPLGRGTRLGAHTDLPGGALDAAAGRGREHPVKVLLAPGA